MSLMSHPSLGIALKTGGKSTCAQLGKLQQTAYQVRQGNLEILSFLRVFRLEMKYKLELLFTEPEMFIFASNRQH
jgi:hypothetical protein